MATVELTAQQKEHLLAARDHLLYAISPPEGFNPTRIEYKEINEIIGKIESIFGY